MTEGTIKLVVAVGTLIIAILLLKLGLDRRVVWEQVSSSMMIGITASYLILEVVMPLMSGEVA